MAKKKSSQKKSGSNPLVSKANQTEKKIKRLKSSKTSADTVGNAAPEITVAEEAAELKPSTANVETPHDPPRQYSMPVQQTTTIPDTWAFDPVNHTLMFEADQTRLATVPLSAELLEALLPQLNALYIASSEAATAWRIRLPDDPDLPPVLSLLRGNVVAASLPLTEGTLADLDDALRLYYTRPDRQRVSPWARLRAWYRRHRILGTLTLILLLPIVLFFLYSVGIQLFTLQ